jgi:hypothetical protein
MMKRISLIPEAEAQAEDLRGIKLSSVGCKKEVFIKRWYNELKRRLRPKG